MVCGRPGKGADFPGGLVYGGGGRSGPGPGGTELYGSVRSAGARGRGRGAAHALPPPPPSSIGRRARPAPPRPAARGGAAISSGAREEGGRPFCLAPAARGSRPEAALRVAIVPPTPFCCRGRDGGVLCACAEEHLKPPPHTPPPQVTSGPPLCSQCPPNPSEYRPVSPRSFPCPRSMSHSSQSPPQYV